MSEQKTQAVLIVDDQPNWRLLLSSILEEEYEVTCVGSYEDACRAVAGQHPPFAAAIVDIRLDDSDRRNEDGLKLLQRINDLPAPANTIILTGYPSIRTTKTAIQELRAMDYLLKYPEDGTEFDFVGLRESVRRAVESFVKRRRYFSVSRTALIIEDEPRWQDILADALDDYVVDCATEFSEAEKKIQTHLYSLVIMDLKLGKCSPEQGMELLEQVRIYNQQAEVIVVSGYDTSQRVRDAFAKYHVRDFLVKSHFSLQQLRSAVKSSEYQYCLQGFGLAQE